MKKFKICNKTTCETQIVKCAKCSSYFHHGCCNITIAMYGAKHQTQKTITCDNCKSCKKSQPMEDKSPKIKIVEITDEKVLPMKILMLNNGNTSDKNAQHSIITKSKIELSKIILEKKIVETTLRVSTSCTTINENIIEKTVLVASTPHTSCTPQTITSITSTSFISNSNHRIEEALELLNGTMVQNQLPPRRINNILDENESLFNTSLAILPENMHSIEDCQMKQGNDEKCVKLDYENQEIIKIFTENEKLKLERYTKNVEFLKAVSFEELSNSKQTQVAPSSSLLGSSPGSRMLCAGRHKIALKQTSPLQVSNSMQQRENHYGMSKIKSQCSDEETEEIKEIEKNRVKQTGTSEKHRVVIIDDEQAESVRCMLQELMGEEYIVSASIKPGSTLRNILESGNKIGTLQDLKKWQMDVERENNNNKISIHVTPVDVEEDDDFEGNAAATPPSRSPRLRRKLSSPAPFLTLQSGENGLLGLSSNHGGLRRCGPARSLTALDSTKRRLSTMVSSAAAAAVSRRLSATLGWCLSSTQVKPQIVRQGRALCLQYIRTQIRRSSISTKKIVMKRLQRMLETECCEEAISNVESGVLAALRALCAALERKRPEAFRHVARQATRAPTTMLRSDTALAELALALARRITTDNITWSKIAAVFCVCGALAREAAEAADGEPSPELITAPAAAIADLLHEETGNWIAIHGGWNNLLERLRVSDRDQRSERTLRVIIVVFVFVCFTLFLLRWVIHAHPSHI